MPMSLGNTVVGKFFKPTNQLLTERLAAIIPSSFYAALSLFQYLYPSGTQQRLGPLAYHV